MKNNRSNSPVEIDEIDFRPFVFTTFIRTWNSTATLLDLNYAYDANGNPTSVNSGEETYGYDELNRLTSASGPFGTLTYSYDQVGNRLSEAVNGTGTTYSYGNYNKLLSAGSATYTYDNNENTVSKSSGSNSWTYAYDSQNRLKQVQLNGQTVLQAKYDGDGRRIQTITGDTVVDDYSAGSWDPVYVKDLSTGVTTDIVFAGGFRLGKIQGGANFYYHLDRLGSVRLVTQTPNLQSFTAKYLPYGNLYATTGAENFQYTGKQLDSSSGLFYYGYRYYDSQIGRFMTQDVIPFKPMPPQTINRYTYVLNDPTTNVDPDGHQYVDPGEVLGPLQGLFGFLEEFGSYGALAVGIIGAAVVAGVLAYDYFAGLHPMPGQLPPSDDAFVAYANELAEARTHVGAEAINQARELIERMLGRKEQDFGFSGPPTKVPGGWI